MADFQRIQKWKEKDPVSYFDKWSEHQIKYKGEVKVLIEVKRVKAPFFKNGAKNYDIIRKFYCFEDFSDPENPVFHKVENTEEGWKIIDTKTYIIDL